MLIGVALLLAWGQAASACEEVDWPLITGGAFQTGSGGQISPVGQGLYPADSFFSVLDCEIPGNEDLRRLEVSGFSVPLLRGNFGETYDITVVDEQDQPTDTIYLLHDTSSGAISTEFPIRAEILHLQGGAGEWGTFEFEITTGDFSRPQCGNQPPADLHGEPMDEQGQAELRASTCIFSLEGDPLRLLNANPVFNRVFSFRLDGYPLPEPGSDAMLLASLGGLALLARAKKRRRSTAATGR